MKGLMIWAHSNCRSTMSFYENFAKELNVPLCIAVYGAKRLSSVRAETGFKEDEFEYLNIIYLEKKYTNFIEAYTKHRDWYHFFGCYQNEPLYRKLMVQILRDGGRYAIGSESPCNMVDGLKRVLKKHYLKYVLPWKLKHAIQGADFFVNYSGDSSDAAQKIGWPKEKIVPFGYFPPPISGSKVSSARKNSPFHILSTGIMIYHRGQDVLMEALCFLKKWGYDFKATFTQNGPLKARLERFAKESDLPIDFPGLLPLDELIGLYEKCSVFVGAGRDEPWGMRLNDALQCGAPLVVSSGMGGAQLVDRYGCGVSFEREDAIGLATQLSRLIENHDHYGRCLNNAGIAASAVAPQNKAAELVATLRKRFPDVWSASAWC